MAISPYFYHDRDPEMSAVGEALSELVDVMMCPNCGGGAFVPDDACDAMCECAICEQHLIWDFRSRCVKCGDPKCLGVPHLVPREQDGCL